jgi:hypothetical protein
MIGFGNYTKEADTVTNVTITSLTDNRLIEINPQKEGFFDAVINFKSTNSDINAFIEAISEVKAAKLEPFYKPIYDPSEDGDIIAYQNGKKPAVGYSYNWWVKTASKMPAVEGRHWHLATEYQYYAFLVWLINQLVKGRKSVEEALNMVVLDSKELGHYYNSQDSTEGKAFECTGSRCVCGVYDFANTYKFLACSNKTAGGCWLGGGYFGGNGAYIPLASLLRGTDVDSVSLPGGTNVNSVSSVSVGLLVL